MLDAIQSILTGPRSISRLRLRTFSRTLTVILLIGPRFVSITMMLSPHSCGVVYGRDARPGVFCLELQTASHVEGDTGHQRCAHRTSHYLKRLNLYECNPPKAKPTVYSGRPTDLKSSCYGRTWPVAGTPSSPLEKMLLPFPYPHDGTRLYKVFSGKFCEIAMG